jgi:EAL domain-containing protein (putative c-di-GMP-specific phosphodiesterase class I)
MHALNKLGCRLAIADFGYGRASFAHLHTLPVDFLKIEGSVAHAMRENPVDYVIAEAVSRVGQMMHMAIIATGVDDARALEKLSELQVAYATGDFIDRGRLLTE